MTILVVGSHGFLGYSLSKRLLTDGHAVIGIDKQRDAVSKKGARVAELEQFKQYRFIDANLSDERVAHEVFRREKFDHAVFLGGRYSQPHSREHVRACMTDNVLAVTNFFEAAAEKGLRRVLYASSTFVQDGVLPRTMYGCTKHYAELCASVYSAQFGMETVGLRFGSVYGPHCRPDVGIYGTMRLLDGGHPINVSQGAFLYRVAFVYVDDAVECMVRFLEAPAQEQKHRVFTIVAEDETRDMGHVLALLERAAGRQANRSGSRQPSQPASVPAHYCEAVRAAIGFAPATRMEEGVEAFVRWWGSR